MKKHKDISNSKAEMADELMNVDTLVARKRLVIGDIHGHLESFLNIMKDENPDDVIILGDYFDNFRGNDQSIIECFKKIISVKHEHEKSGKGKFIMLIGNHDFQYICTTEHYSGKRATYAEEAKSLLDKAIADGDLQYFFIDDTNLTAYSHAGITNRWMNQNMICVDDLNDLEHLANFENMKFCFGGGETGYGNGLYASPIWVRPNTLLQDMYFDELSGKHWVQIVGHTHSREPKIHYLNGAVISGAHTVDFESYEYDPENSPILYVMDSMPDFYIVEDIDDVTGKMISRTVKHVESYGNDSGTTISPWELFQKLCKEYIDEQESHKCQS